MPIKEKLIKSGLDIPVPCIGSIHKGGPKTANKPGPDLDHFRFVLQAEKREMDRQQRGEVENYHRIITDLYGAKPKRLTGVRLASPTPDGCFMYYYEQWGKGGIEHRCDGETQSAHWTGKKRSREPIPCIRDSATPCQCVPTGRLAIVLEDFTITTGIVGFFMLTTHSKTEIDRFSSSLEKYYQWFGNLAKIPFTVERIPEEMPFDGVDKQGNPVKAHTTKWLMVITPEPAFVATAPGLGAHDAAALQLIDPSRLQIAAPKEPRLEQRERPQPGAEIVTQEAAADVEALDLGLNPVLLQAFFDDANETLDLAPGIVQQLVFKAVGKRSFRGVGWYQAAKIIGLNTMPPDTRSGELDDDPGENGNGF